MQSVALSCATNNSLTATHLVPGFHGNLPYEGQINVAPRSELDEPNPFAALHRIPRLNPSNYPSGNHSGNLSYCNPLAGCAGDPNQNILVRLSRIRSEGAEKLPWLVGDENNFPRDRRILNMHVED
jgi:hypothetical protein